ncbi:MAG: hypothetical protein ACMUEL_02565 [Flavobacteriales bacterium Tduv]
MIIRIIPLLGIKRLFRSNKARYKRLARVHAQHLMKAMDIIYIMPLALLCAVHKNKYN